jgi:hypothetical protein
MVGTLRFAHPTIPRKACDLISATARELPN